MTLKTILKNFLNYADTLDAQKKLGKDIYEADFQKLKGLTEELKHDDDYNTSEGLKEVNRRKNRYKDILPYDYTRVILSEYPGVPGSDYINANYIKGASGSLAYIASQGPLPNTVVDFWRMIWECEIQVIVMACNEQESGKYKCECYWPTDEEKKQYGNINVEFVKWRQVCPDFLVRTLKACWENEERVICQFHYTTWPDHGVPNSVQPILELVRLIRDCQASEAVPVLIHCSAGCGRTGTICAIDYVWGLMRMGKLTKNFNLYNVIADMRRQRIAMVQTKEQYVLVHKAVSSLFEQQLRVIDSHTYENLDEDGEPLILKELHQQEEDIYEDILDPPLLDESHSSNEKLVERKLHPSNPLHDYATVNKDAPPIPSKRDPFPENLLNFSKNLYYKPDSDILEKHETHPVNNQEGKNEQSLKNIEGETELPNSRNSQILMRLCREESVKRLISGWNKAVEQSDDIKNISKDIYFENNFHSKTPLKKLSDHILNERKNPLSANDKKDVLFSSKTENPTMNSTDKFEDLSDHRTLNDSSTKSSPPEDVHAGKLVGKATVIRRPSIAKLKALFEKSSSNGDSSETGRRRALFRSHSHYVSHTSRPFTLSDSTSYVSNSNSESRSPLALKTEENKSEKERINIQNSFDSVFSDNLEKVGILNLTYSTQQATRTDNIDCLHSSNSNRKTIYKVSQISADNDRESTMLTNSLENSTNCSSVYESHFHAHDLIDNLKVKAKQTPSNSSKKDKPPELPVKKKPVIPLPQISGYVEKNKESEITVPRFKVNVPKENVFLESSHKVSNLQKETASKNSNQTEKSFKEVSSVKTSVASPDWNSDDSLREYVRRSQEVQKHVLHKNQSFSDPEQSARYIDQSIKQVAKPKLSLTDQTYPKLTYSAEKGLDEKLAFSHECAYMNVNSLAQKNIRQIEEKLKNHPRGAIIDLTSRKSYIDGMASTPDRQYIFKNTSEPVKFLQKQEARELLPQDKVNSRTEQIGKDPASKIQTNVSNSKSVALKSENSRNELDHLNSKNLLLHSPPPKTKRGHLSKSNLRGPLITSNSPDSNEVSSDSKQFASNTSDKTSKAVNSPNYISANVSQNVSSTINHPSPAADRSDPRYFPVTRQTASDAKYESEKHKAEAREAASGRQINTYEPLYSSKPVNPSYHKYPASYDKATQETKDFKYPPDSSKSNFDKEPLYGLQRSTSGPQILPSADSNQKIPHSSDMNGSYNIYGQISEDNKMSKSFHGAETRAISQYDTNQAYAIYGTSGQHNMFPPGPPKPPRTFHYDMKSNPEKASETYNKTDHNIKREGGRYIVSIASPKHSSIQNPMQATNIDYRYDRIPDTEHVTSKNVYQPQPTYVSPISNEVHMSKSYPLTNYDRSYYPRPYGKQYYPESVTFRNVHPVHHVSNNIYAVPEKPPYPQKNIYGTVRHQNTFSDYENIYDAQMEYMRTMANSSTKNEHQNIYQSLNPNSVAGLQYSQSDANVYGVLQPPKIHTQFAKGHGSTDRDFKNVNENSGNSVPKRVYFDTLQRKNKQHVTWEQRRSHDDMDIRTAPSARLREQIHARRSMVELDNLEISVASDEGYPEKNIVDSLTSPTSSYSKVQNFKNDRLGDISQNKSREENNDSSKDYLRRNSVPIKEPASFGETISKAFGKLTSFTKFNTKEAQSCSSVPIESSNTSSKVSKQKEKDKHHNFTLQSPSSSKESPSEQWTQV